MNQKFVILKGCAGLGNRLITLQKAILYAKKSRRKLYVDWSDGMFAAAGQNAFYKYFSLSEVNYTDKFEDIENILKGGGTLYPKGVTIQELKEGLYDNFWHVGTWLSWNVAAYRIAVTMLLKGKITSILGLQSWQHKSDEKESWFNNIMNVYRERNIQLGAQLPRHINRDVVIFVDFRPLVNISNIFNYIHLKDEYSKKFLQFAEQHSLPRNGIGVHVRATDKQPKQKIEKLFFQLDNLLNTDEKYVVFLSTDNIQMVNTLKLKYKERIITYPKFLPQDLNGKGIHHWALEHNTPNIKEQMFEESLADMWILSMCKILYWQGNSSFSLISSIMKEDKNNVYNWMRL